MKPEERQLALVAYLQQHRFGRTLPEIERDLPDYGTGEAARKKLQRDRRLLEGLGLPIRVVAQEGDTEDGNLCYSYVLDRREVFARPLRLSGAQRGALERLGRRLHEDAGFPHRAWAATAWEKLAAADAAAGPLAEMARDLPDEERSIDERMPVIQEAIAARTKLRIGYPGLKGVEARTVRPLGLLLRRGFWFLAAWCEARAGIRQFRVRRIDGLVTLDERFDPPADFDLAALARRRGWEAGLAEEGRPATVRFDAALAPLARRALDGLAEFVDDGGALLARVRVAEEEPFFAWLLGWGPRVRLAGPEPLKKRLKSRLEQALAVLEDEGAPR